MMMSLTKPLGGRAVLMKQRSGRAGAESALHEGRADEADTSKTDYRRVYERRTHSFRSLVYDRSGKAVSRAPKYPNDPFPSPLAGN